MAVLVSIWFVALNQALMDMDARLRRFESLNRVPLDKDGS